MIFHITSKSEWKKAQTRGEYVAPSLETEGFIHCSTEKQVLQVANAFYRGQNDAGPPAPGISDSDKFPHIFGPINLAAVASALDFEPDSAQGTFSLPRLSTDN
jgi:uncharacterized protein (DUF952 family)